MPTLRSISSWLRSRPVRAHDDANTPPTPTDRGRFPTVIDVHDSFPRQHARTQRFTLGEPRNLTVSPDGERLVFLRSGAGDDPVSALWVMDTATGEEALVADPRTLLGTDDLADSDVTDDEQARRERTRDGTTGITAYATDSACKVAAFALSGEAYVAGLLSGQARRLPIAGPVFDPRPDPTATRLAYVSGRQLRVGELDGSSRAIAGDDPKEADTVSWGSAEFIAAEEMNRHRGFWWSPDGQTLAACRVDTAPVQRWTIGDPGDPARPARSVRYPAAGTENAIVTLHLLGLDGSRRDVDWDREFFPYITRVDWTEQGLLVAVQARDQRGSMAMRVDVDTGEGVVLASDYDDAWIDIVPGTPRLLDDGRLLTAADRDGVRRLVVDGDPITPDDLQVRSVASVTEAGVLFTANDPNDATEQHAWLTAADGEAGAITEHPGVHSAVAGGPTIVVRSATLDEPGTSTTVLVDGLFDGPVVASHAETPILEPDVTLRTYGEESLATAIVLPDGHDGGPLPVLLDPYGGPHALRVVKASNAFLSTQWFANQGFAVVVVDGRGTPGRGSAWERAVRNDLATPVLDDQITALDAAAAEFDFFDLDRVAIRGWSFGGYLAALAVLRRPDVFHAAIAGAPVTEWRLYDTHYTERYLGDPRVDDRPYETTSLLPLAGDLTRPLLLIHGLADDNVVAAHTLQLSSALLAAGKPHEVLPLVGISHMTPQEVVAENLLRHQLDFLRRALDITEAPTASDPKDDR
jgi:dipeptidyl-peptidase-4